MMLRGSGVQVTEAANGQEALKILNGGERKFDCIFMDCNMPVMDGLECARQIRLCEARDGGLRHTPIIAHTANGEAEHAERRETAPAEPADVATTATNQRAEARRR